MILEIFKKLIIQSLPCSVNIFRHILKLRLKDQLIQIWYGNISESRKKIIVFLKIILNLPDSLRNFFTKFRFRNHRLPIERGCNENIPPDMPLCHYCREDIQCR